MANNILNKQKYTTLDKVRLICMYSTGQKFGHISFYWFLNKFLMLIILYIYLIFKNTEKNYNIVQ